MGFSAKYIFIRSVSFELTCWAGFERTEGDVRGGWLNVAFNFDC